jgi:hypothetical protein
VSYTLKVLNPNSVLTLTTPTFAQAVIAAADYTDEAFIIYGPDGEPLTLSKAYKEKVSC